MNPCLAGTLLGLVLLLAMVVAGRGLGASGGIKYCVVSIVGAVSPPHVDNSEYYSKYFEDGGQLARGCTSGAALSGMAVLSLAGFVTMIAIFGSAFAFA